MERSQIYDFGRSVVGYMLNTDLSEKNQLKITKLQQTLDAKFPNVLWLAPGYSLHITLMDWIAPLVDYGQSKDALFRQIQPKYDAVLYQAMAEVKPIDVRFNKVAVFPGAIILLGEDNGDYVRIRQTFLDNVELLANTKLPPKIIHCTIARYKKEVDIAKIKAFAQTLNPEIRHKTTEFRLVRESSDPMVNFKVIGSYKL